MMKGKKLLKRLVSISLMVAMLFSMMMVPASAATDNYKSLGVTLKGYTISDSYTAVYRSSSCSWWNWKDTISGSTLVTVLGYSGNKNYAKVRYGSQTGYIKRTAILSTSSTKFQEYYTTKTTRAYRKCGGTYVKLASGTTVYCLGASNGYRQIMYKSGSTYYLRWIKSSDFNSLCYSVKSRTYTLVTALNSSKALDVYGGKTANRTNVDIYNKNGSGAQKFKVTGVGSGWYKIINTKSGKALDVANGTRGSGANVQIYSWNGTDAQLWRFYKNSDGSYCIQNKLGYYLNVYGGYTDNYTNVWVYKKDGTKSERWYLRS